MFAETIFYAITIGLIPALLWLWIWLHEDTEHPEPKYMIAISFVAGMFMAPLAALVQIALFEHWSEGVFLFMGITVSYNMIAWVAAEELLKFAGSYFALKNKRVFDEPVDGMVYLITTALGFVAVENTIVSKNATSNATVSFLSFNKDKNNYF